MDLWSLLLAPNAHTVGASLQRCNKLEQCIRAGARKYAYMDVSDRVESRTETENNAGAIIEVRKTVTEKLLFLELP